MATLEPVTRIEQFLSDIIDQGGGGGGSGGGSNVFLANASVQVENGQTTATCDKTFSEINAAYTAGQIMLCNIVAEDFDNGYSGIGLAVLSYSPPNPFDPNESFRAVISSCNSVPPYITKVQFGINSAQTFGSMSIFALPEE